MSLRSIKEKEANVVLIWNNITNCLVKWKNGFFFFFLNKDRLYYKKKFYLMVNIVNTY